MAQNQSPFPNKKIDPKTCKHDSPDQVQGQPCPLCGIMPTAQEWKGEPNNRKRMS